MILNMKFEDVTSTAVKGEVNGKTMTFFMFVDVTTENIEQAIEKFRGNKNVVGLRYSGDLDALNSLDLSSTKVFIEREVQDLDINVDFLLGEINKSVTVIIRLPEKFYDMRKIEEFSKKYPNARFEGGKFIRLDGCNIGTFGKEDIPKKIADSRIPLTTEGNASIVQVFHIDDLDEVIFYEGKTSTKPKKKSEPKKSTSTPKKPKPKKRLSSLLDLGGGSSSLDNF